MVAILKTTDAVVSGLCTAMTGVLAFLVMFSVVLRYCFNITFTQMEEAICVLFSATTFLGAALGIREKSHIAVPGLSELVGPRARRWLQVGAMVGIIVVASTVLWTSIIWIAGIGSTNSLALQIPCGYYYSVVPLSFSILIFYCVVDIAAQFFPVPEADKGYLADSDFVIPGEPVHPAPTERRSGPR